MTRRRLPIEADVLVAGGGMAGLCAALAAARLGACVVLLQDRSVLGGNASSEVRMHIVGADVHGQRLGWREPGLIEELRLEDAVRNPARCFPLWDLLLYEKAVAEPNLRLLLDTALTGVEMERGGRSTPDPPRNGRMIEHRGRPGRIRAVLAARESTGDLFRVEARHFVDCTGDARLGWEAGADFRIGRESRAHHGEPLAREMDDDQTLGSSILFTSRKHEAPVPFVPPPWARKLTEADLAHRPIGGWEYGFWWAEWGGQLDTIHDSPTVIRHELYGIALGIWDHIKNSGRFPASANWTLDWIGHLPGKRESRRLLGPHILTQQDVESGGRFPDEVAYGGWPLDDHPPSGIDARGEPPARSIPVPAPYGIPLRCLMSRNVENLWMAGRCLSATHVALSSSRVMATCAGLGQAAGTAAAIAALQRTGEAVRMVEDSQRLAAVQRALWRMDGPLLHVRPDDPLDLARQATAQASSYVDGCVPAAVVEGVTRDEVDPKTGATVRPHHWGSDPGRPLPQWVELIWPEPVRLAEIELIFDTGFHRPLMLTASDQRAYWGVRGPQPETVRDYRIEADDKAVAEARGNYLRLRRHRFEPVTCRRLRVIVTATNGAPDARLFRIGAYAPETG